MSPRPLLCLLTCSIGLAECIPVAGERILAGDLAHAVPAFAGLPPELPLGYAPVPGSRRAYSAADLARLARRYGLAVEPGVEACFARPAEVLTEERVAAALEAALPSAHIEVVEFSRQPTPNGELRFPLSGLSTPPDATPDPVLLWRGQVRRAGEEDFPVWAKARIRVSGTRAVASEFLPAGKPIEPSQFRLEAYEGPPGLATPSEIAGRAPRQGIPVGAIIQARWLEAPLDVMRGESVRVEVLSGQARVVLEGLAQASGRRGETVRVRNPATGKIFTARVAARGQVRVAAGRPVEEGR